MAKIRKGDRVVVLSGKDRGRQGVVSAVFPEKGTALVDGVNVVKKHQKPRQGTGVLQGGIIDMDMPVPLARIAVVSPSDGRPTRVGYRFDDDGNKVRVCKRTGVDLP